MKRDLLGAVAGLLALSALAGCVTHDVPTATNQLVILNVVKLDAPATVSAGGSLTVVLTVFVSCRAFDHIEASRTGSQIVLTALGTDTRPEADEACPFFVLPQTESFHLDPPFPTAFTVAVRQPNDNLDLIANVRVQ
jgi:hypothetical protein